MSTNERISSDYEEIDLPSHLFQIGNLLGIQATKTQDASLKDLLMQAEDICLCAYDFLNSLNLCEVIPGI